MMEVKKMIVRAGLLTRPGAGRVGGREGERSRGSKSPSPGDLITFGVFEYLFGAGPHRGTFARVWHLLPIVNGGELDLGGALVY